MATIITPSGNELSVPYSEVDYTIGLLVRFGIVQVPEELTILFDSDDHQIVYSHKVHLTEVLKGGDFAHRTYYFSNWAEARLILDQFERLNKGSPDGRWAAWSPIPVSSMT